MTSFFASNLKRTGRRSCRARTRTRMPSRTVLRQPRRSSRSRARQHRLDELRRHQWRNAPLGRLPDHRSLLARVVRPRTYTVKGPSKKPTMQPRRVTRKHGNPSAQRALVRSAHLRPHSNRTNPPRPRAPLSPVRNRASRPQRTCWRALLAEVKSWRSDGARR